MERADHLPADIVVQFLERVIAIANDDAERKEGRAPCTADIMAPVTFSALFGRLAWRQIRNCPGRFLLAEGPVATPPENIVPGASGRFEHVCATAKDPVIVTPFDDGGLISYRKADGTFLHTLNTREGFERKLRQLGIRAGVDCPP